MRLALGLMVMAGLAGCSGFEIGAGSVNALPLVGSLVDNPKPYWQPGDPVPAVTPPAYGPGENAPQKVPAP